MSMQDASRSPSAGAARPAEFTLHESRLWGVLTQAMTLLPNAIDGQVQRDAGVTYFEYCCLASLAAAPQRRMRMSELAEATHGSLSRLSHVAQRLQRQGLLTRASDPQDRRTTIATLTQSGMARVLMGQPGHVALSRALVLDALSPADQDRLAELIAAFLPRLTRQSTS